MNSGKTKTRLISLLLTAVLALCSAAPAAAASSYPPEVIIQQHISIWSFLTTGPRREENPSLPSPSQTESSAPAVSDGSFDQAKNMELYDTRLGCHAGNCYELEGSPYVMAIFLDDDTSCWTEDEVISYWHEILIPGMDFMEQKAADWGVALDFQSGFYATYAQPGMPLRYNGTVATYLDGTYTRDLLEQVAASLGFETKYAMHEHLQNFSGQEQIAYLVILNKTGRSYSMRYTHLEQNHPDRDRFLEYGVFYAGFSDGQYNVTGGTISHEMFHLFGADDYYQPAKREALAKVYYPNDVMMDHSAPVVGDMTAYCVGWTDREPEICQNPDWWE